MKTVIIACKTLEDELESAVQNIGVSYPILWLESGLHNTPKKLNRKLQEILDDLKADRVLAVLGFCGNSVLGIKAGDFELIIPRVDDCISLLLGSVKERAEVSRQYAAYFLTGGWLRGERNMWTEYQYTRDRYGEEQAKYLSKMMFSHYRTLGILDSGAVLIEPLVDETKIIADTLGLEQKVIPASVAYIQLLLTGPWPEDKFLVTAPGQTIANKDLYF